MGDVLVIVGPTASGKTALAISMARDIGAEIVGTDSMQAYRRMDIGTATPSLEERAGVPHHMLDTWDPAEEVSVVQFREQARACIDDIRSRGSTAIVTGGSGLYVSAVMDSLEFPGTDPAVRARLEAQEHELGTAAMYQELQAVDPGAAAEILPTNTRRIIRALEVNEITGHPFVARLPAPQAVYPSTWVGLDIPRDVLDERIADRVDAMFTDGFVDEVERLGKGELGRTAAMALGYPQVAAALRGDSTWEQARQETIDATRRFARRQQRWFRRDARVQWLGYDRPDLVEAVTALWAGTRT